jgi:alkylation response protein AidB-like acyl-CoA dehydrogenase
VDSKSKGIDTNPIQKLGYKGSSACEIVLEDVVVPETNILGGTEFLNRGWPLLLGTLDVEHIEVAACGLGIAEGAFEDSLDYAKQREQFGHPIGNFQAISHMLAEMYTEIEASRLIIQRTSWLIQNDQPCSIESAMAKYYATETAKKVSLQGMQILGGYGYTMEYDVQRYIRDALVLPIGGGTTQIMKNIIAGRLGL